MSDIKKTQTKEERNLYMKKYRESNKDKISKIKEKYKNNHSRKIPDHLRKPRKPKMTDEERRERAKTYRKATKYSKIKKVKEAPLPIVPENLYLYKDFQNEKDFPKDYAGYCIKRGIPIFVPIPITEYELRDLTGWIRHERE